MKSLSHFENKLPIYMINLLVFLTDFEEIGKSIDKSKESYDKAINKLSSGRGNLISRAEKFLDLGVKPNKKISEKYLLNQE